MGLNQPLGYAFILAETFCVTLIIIACSVELGFL